MAKNILGCIVAGVIVVIVVVMFMNAWEREECMTWKAEDYTQQWQIDQCQHHGLYLYAENHNE